LPNARCGFGDKIHYANLGRIGPSRNVPDVISMVVLPAKIGNKNL
jgi:hypothetical protein